MSSRRTQKPVRKTTQYDVCLSFAGEDRSYVKKVADILTAEGVRVFYDEYEKGHLWGKDLYSHLDDVYRFAARYCVLFLSKYYAKKVWTNHELRSAQARALNNHSEYVLPARFDSTQIPGLRDTVGYINLKSTTPRELAELIVGKIGPRPRKNYFPPVPDRLYESLGANSAEDFNAIHTIALDFFFTLQRMNISERRVVYNILRFGCPAELPDNMHISLDYLRRVSKVPPSKAIRIISGIRSLGFSGRIRNGHHEVGRLGNDDPVLVLEWDCMSPAVDLEGTQTAVAEKMIDLATDLYCEKCGTKALENLDFAQLSSSTLTPETHSSRSKPRKPLA